MHTLFHKLTHSFDDSSSSSSTSSSSNDEDEPARMLRIAFGHKSKVGKNHAATIVSDYIHSRGNHRVHQLAFAKPIYDILWFTQHMARMEYKKDRDFLIMVGEWAKKQAGDAVWANVVEHDIECIDQSGHIIVTDVRFDAEVQMLKRQGFHLVRIDRNVESFNGDEQLDTFTDWDDIIINNGSIPEFNEKIIACVDRLLEL